uniref:F-box domain-containing protein n=1 Tax=Kalanchoe fedtschenkoi TaxID=63787 RepID=A0A7N0UNI5_KALFE
MGQAASSSSSSSTFARRDNSNHHQLLLFASKSKSSQIRTHNSLPQAEPGPDYTFALPDECLACIFQSLGPLDRKRCSLVCRRWLRVDGQSRHRLSLQAPADLLPIIPSLFTRFDSVAKLSLKCDRRSVSVGDEALVLISIRCPNLTRLKLRACRELTNAGMAAFAKNCKGLKKLSCGSCTFGAQGINAVLDNCSSLQELSVKRLRSVSEGAAAETIRPGLAASSLKTICLKELYNGHCFGPLIIESKNLTTLKIFKCTGDWDKLLEKIAHTVTGLVEVHAERIQFSDAALEAVSGCPELEILRLIKTPECTNLGLKVVAERCKLLRKLHIDGWKANRIGDEGLIAVAKHCPKLQELVLIGVNPTNSSLEPLALNCVNLERLALCSSDTVGDAEISCIAAKCTALKKLCIKSCPVSDQSMEALAKGCPNLVKVKVKKCRAITHEGADLLMASRESLAVNLDAGDPVPQDPSSSDGVQDVVEFPHMHNQVQLPNITSRSAGRSSLFKARIALLSRKNLMACTLRRWSSFSHSPRQR